MDRYDMVFFGFRIWGIGFVIRVVGGMIDVIGLKENIVF